MKTNYTIFYALFLTFGIQAISISDLNNSGQMPKPTANGNLDLSRKGINSINGIEDIVNASSGTIKSINLSRNKISSVNANQIAAAGPSLKSIDLSYNPLVSITGSRDKLKVSLNLTGTRFATNEVTEQN